jgi:hypothetical protein
MAHAESVSVIVLRDLLRMVRPLRSIIWVNRS